MERRLKRQSIQLKIDDGETRKMIHLPSIVVCKYGRTDRISLRRCSMREGTAPSNALLSNVWTSRSNLPRRRRIERGITRSPMALSVDSYRIFICRESLEWTDGSFANGVSRGIGRRP